MIVNENNNDIQTDEMLVKAVINGNSDQFTTIIQRYHKRLLGWAYKLIHDPIVAEDIVQETFLRAFRGIKTCNKPESFRIWLFSIARNCALDWIDKKRTEIAKVNLDMKEMDELLVADTNTDSVLDDKLKTLKCAFKNLSSDMRVVLILKYWKGKSCEEISKLLKLPIGTVMSHLSRSYKALREQINISEQKNHV